jgi:hypothetical protein
VNPQVTTILGLALSWRSISEGVKVGLSPYCFGFLYSIVG